MTDLCFEEGAEEKTHQAFEKAIELNPRSIDALQGLANVHILRARHKQARPLLKKVLELLFN